jgi:outer membrane immunogenic protein
MRKLLYGAAAAVCLGAAGPAMANGSMKDVVVVEPAPMWSGCYLGANIGGAWTDDNSYSDLRKSTKIDDDKVHPEPLPDVKTGSGSIGPDPIGYDKAYDYHNKYRHEPSHWKTDYSGFSFDDNIDDSTLIGGLHVGCNWERGTFVYGVESDIGFGNDFDYLASIRGRLGTTWDSSHLYLTGGVAFARFDRDFSVSYIHDGNSFERRFDVENEETGFVLGAGWEYLYKPNWSFGIEGLYYWFDDDAAKYEWLDGYDGSSKCYDPCDHYHGYEFERDSDQEVFVIRARMNYHIRRAPEPLK